MSSHAGSFVSNAAPVPAWCLRFMNGALRGRTLALAPGLNVLGSSSDADVILPAGSVLGRHLVLEVGALALTARRCADATAELNGVPLHDARRCVVAGDVLALGEIELEVDTVETAAQPHDALFASTPPAPSSAPSAAALGRGVRSAMAALALVTATGATVLAFTRGAAPAGATSSPASLAAVQAVLREFPEAHALAGADRIGVRGFVETQARRDALRAALARVGPGVDVAVLSAEELLEQARRFVSDPAVTFVYAGQGRLVASGTVEDEAVRRQLRLLSEDLHPAAIVTDKVMYRPRPARAKAAAADAPAPGWKGLLPAPVIGVGTDALGQRHVQLANGSRYYEGATLQSGALLQRIETDRLVLSDGPPAPVSQ